ncbi:MAG: LysM peptidoglycan-binding domain-containing protein [Enterococcus sp.]
MQSGEGLQQIAARTGVPAETIAALNGITITGNTFYPAISPGQTLTIGQ